MCIYGDLRTPYCAVRFTSVCSSHCTAWNVHIRRSEHSILHSGDLRGHVILTVQCGLHIYGDLRTPYCSVRSMWSRKSPCTVQNTNPACPYLFLSTHPCPSLPVPVHPSLPIPLHPCLSLSTHPYHSCPSPPVPTHSTLSIPACPYPPNPAHP